MLNSASSICGLAVNNDRMEPVALSCKVRMLDSFGCSGGNFLASDSHHEGFAVSATIRGGHRTSCLRCFIGRETSPGMQKG